MIKTKCALKKHVLLSESCNSFMFHFSVRSLLYSESYRTAVAEKCFYVFAVFVDFVK